VKGFKKIESLPSQSQATSERSAITVADESEASKNETINDDVLTPSSPNVVNFTQTLDSDPE